MAAAQASLGGVEHQARARLVRCKFAVPPPPPLRQRSRSGAPNLISESSADRQMGAGAGAGAGAAREGPGVTTTATATPHGAKEALAAPARERERELEGRSDWEGGRLRGSGGWCCEEGNKKALLPSHHSSPHASLSIPNPRTLPRRSHTVLRSSSPVGCRSVRSRSRRARSGARSHADHITEYLPPPAAPRSFLIAFSVISSIARLIIALAALTASGVGPSIKR